jgi:hypothetical protein
LDLSAARRPERLAKSVDRTGADIAEDNTESADQPAAAGVETAEAEIVMPAPDGRARQVLLSRWPRVTPLKRYRIV